MGTTFMENIFETPYLNDMFVAVVIRLFNA